PDCCCSHRSATSRSCRTPDNSPATCYTSLSTSSNTKTGYRKMSDWLHNLPVLWMALVVLGVTYLVAALICEIVNAARLCRPWSVPEREIAVRLVRVGERRLRAG